MSRPLVFIAAEARECEPFVRRWNSVRDPGLNVRWARAGVWHARPVIALANGAGVKRSEAAADAVPNAAAFVSLGFCGALDPALRLGDVVLSTSVTEFTGRKYEALIPAGCIVATGGVYTSDRIAGSVREKEELRKTGASVVEMEASGVARASERFGVPFYAVRVVSDTADAGFRLDFNKALLPDGRFSVPRLLMDAMRSPVNGIRELMRLQRDTAAAAEKLGDFLADCRF